VAKHGKVSSLQFDPSVESYKLHDNSDKQEEEGPNLTTIGLGLFPFKWRDHDLYALHQTRGHPVALACGGVDFFTNLILFAPAADSRVLGQFCKWLIDMNECTEPNTVNIWEWDPMNQYWQTRTVCRPRPIDSVVLPKPMKDRLLNDMKEFLAADTKQWYSQHGIPHKRGYLFFGEPGSGKTSLIQAVAGLFEYNICYVHLTHPHLTDDSLRHAVDQAPSRSMLIIEDVDAVFGQDREKLMKEVPLTFSGLLNSLDGVGKTDGQIFILTTNHHERLNPALIRNGRADVHIEFSLVTDEQIEGMFKRFYPSSTAMLAKSFTSSVREALAGKEVSAAALQHFFILHRRSSAADAASAAADVVAELDQRAGEKELRAKERREKELEQEEEEASQP
jgi:chaperone BCS1